MFLLHPGVAVRRNLAWRAAGLLMVVAGYAANIACDPDKGFASLIELGGFLLMIAGLVLIVQGRRVGMALRIERSGHRALPLAIHSRRLAGRRER